MQQYAAKKHQILMVLGLFLCVYFLYHSFHGSRSYPKLMSLEKTIEQMQSELSVEEATRLVLEKKVVMLRPGSINKDLLEERARLVLGYKSPDEFMILDN